MDKNAIKKYAVWARRELISRVSQRAALYEITADGYGNQNASSVHGRLMSAEEKKQRTALIAQIKEKGYEQVMEEIAYTWFNRFSALRFMEVNGYLPTRIRVFTNDNNAFKPQILDEAINMEMDGLDMQKVYDLKNANDDDALFKYLIIVQCNALYKILPGMFQRISDYTELLFPDNLLREGSVLEQMIAMIPQEDWTDQVQIIGWLYQYYNTEPKDLVFANLKKNIKISKENIPAATQLFTPDWIVRYMVENSLGRLWLEGHSNDELKAGWIYYIDEAKQEPDVQAQLVEIRKEYAALKPEDILVIDPCQGSGHILAYMFDVLVQIYEAYGYSAREASACIVENNIWGLDIDERAAQLAYFSVMMKARQYDRRFFSRGIQPHVYAILESNNLDPHCIEYFVDGRKELKYAMDTLVKELRDAREYGSILNVTQVDFDALYARFEEIQNDIVPGIYSYQTLDTLLPFVQVAQALSQKYHAVITNPPYMGGRNMNNKLSSYIKEHYSDYKSDLFSAFVIRCSEMAIKYGKLGFFTPYVWMFLQSYEKMRLFLYKKSIETLIQFEYSAFEEATVPVCTFVFSNNSALNKKGCYLRLTDFRGGMEVQREKTIEAISNHNCGYYYEQNPEAFSSIPGRPVAYWVGKEFFDMFIHGVPLGAIADSKQGMATADNNRFLREWYEVCFSEIKFDSESLEDAVSSGYKWFPYNKGGEFRKWYGNNDFIVNWENDGFEIRNFFDDRGKLRSRPQNLSYMCKSSVSWSDITSETNAFRFKPNGHFFDITGMSIFSEKYNKYLLALCNTKMVTEILKIIAPTMHCQCGDVANIPVIMNDYVIEQVGRIVDECISDAKTDWDSFETSWDFSISPLVGRESTIESAFEKWSTECLRRFNRTKKNEETLNHIIGDLYGLSGSFSLGIDDRFITIRKADLSREICGLISYAVGCMFGRYSLDIPGLAYAGGLWDDSKYISFQPDKNAIIPICGDEYFEDDIVGRFIKFLKVVYGSDTLEENLSFIARALGGKGSSREVIRNYFSNGFYSDHLKMYQKRPIYWLFDSGKKNSFKCLIYMHRYQSDTIARIRTDYVHEQQSRYRTAIADLKIRVSNAGTGNRVKLKKQLEGIRAQAEELRIYEEKIHHLADQMIRINLDDGIKHNYAIFQDVLARVK